MRTGLALAVVTLLASPSLARAGGVMLYEVGTPDMGLASAGWAAQKDRLKLREKYYGKVAKATSNKTAARFMQVENTLGMLLDLQIAVESPLME